MKLSESMFAGSWYPKEKDKCKKQIDSFISTYGAPDHETFATIVPHAGWTYSGKIACNTIRLLSEGKKPDTIIIFGMHMHTRSIPCLSASGEWETPFGFLPVDSELALEIESSSGIRFQKAQGSFSRDNTIELQLPFVRYFFGDVKIVCIGVPPSESAVTAGIHAVRSARKLGRSIKVISSTDLTHYGPNYGFHPKGRGMDAVEWVKKQNDAGFIVKACSLDPDTIIKEALYNQNACCPGAAAAFAAASRENGLGGPANLVDYFTSYDIIPSDSFVGYAGIII